MAFRYNSDPVAGRDSVRANKQKFEDEIAQESSNRDANGLSWT